VLGDGVEDLLTKWLLKVLLEGVSNILDEVVGLAFLED
jgi:hypothetical protein